MASRPSKSKPNPVDEREQFLLAHQRSFAGVQLPPAAIEDLKYFEGAARKGRAIRTDALLAWLKSKHGIEVGQAKLFRLAADAGVTPWFSKR